MGEAEILTKASDEVVAEKQGLKASIHSTT